MFSIYNQICVNTKTKVVLRDTEFALSITQGCGSSPQQSGYICEAKDCMISTKRVEGNNDYND